MNDYARELSLPAAPGTSIQNAGRYVTKYGGPARRRLIHSAAGVIARAPKNADSSASKTTAAIDR